MDVINKICPKCGIEKSMEEFGWRNKIKGWRQVWCKMCMRVYYKTPKARAAQAVKRNSPEGKAYIEVWNHSPEGRAAMTAYLQTPRGRAKAAAYAQTPKRKASKAVYAKTPKCKEIKTAYAKRRRLTDINFKLADRLRSRLSNALHGNFKAGSFVRDLNCTISELRQYLESKFQPGMTWKNWGRGSGKWQLDHIIPLCRFDLSNREEFLKAAHYTNLQPLWYDDHIQKTIKDIANIRSNP